MKIFSIEFAMDGNLLERNLTKDDVAVILRNAAKALDHGERGAVYDWRTNKLIGAWGIVEKEDPPVNKEIIPPDVEI